MNKLVPYITKENDTWDKIANEAYAVPMSVSDIIEANPGVPITPVLPTGIKIMIPVIPEAFVETNKQDLPPWKR